MRRSEAGDTGKALSIMDEMVDTAIDANCYQVLKDCLAELEVTAA